MTNSLNLKTIEGEEISEEELSQIMEDYNDEPDRTGFGDKKHFRVYLDEIHFGPVLEHKKTGKKFLLTKELHTSATTKQQ